MALRYAAPSPDRIAAIDTVRGVAVLGILVMNIAAFGLPVAAYQDPRAWGGAAGADLAAWALAFAIADGKMRGLFAMLFGASLVLVADRAEAAGDNPAAVHYRRMAALLLIGLVHAWTIWFGDILVEYAVSGAILFVAWRWHPGALFYAAAALLAIDLAMQIDLWWRLAALRDAVALPGASAETVAEWRRLATPDVSAIAAEIAGYRGGIARVFTTRWADALALQASIPNNLVETLGLGTLGIALYRVGYFTHWPAARHLILIGIGYGVALPLTIPVVDTVIARGFDTVAQAEAGVWSLLLRPWVMLAHASLVMLTVRSDGLRWLTSRLAAAGRMALSNYLATSLICTTIFYGTGFGLFGRLDRAELAFVVLPVWLLILLWSRPWLARFVYGPAEWAWRQIAHRIIP